MEASKLDHDDNKEDKEEEIEENQNDERKILKNLPLSFHPKTPFISLILLWSLTSPLSSFSVTL